MSCESFTLIDANGNETKLSDYGLYVGRTSSGMPTEDLIPNNQNVTTGNIIRKNGELFFSQNLGTRTISVPVYFDEPKTEHEANTIKQKFYRDVPTKFIWGRHPYKYIWVVSDGAIDTSYIWYENDRFVNFFTIKYVAFDPLYYSLFDSTNLPAYLEDMGTNPDYAQLYFDIGMPWAEDLPAWEYVATSNGSVTLNNYGNYRSKLEIEMTGEGTNIVFTNTANDDSFTISSMSGGETVIVDGNNGQIRDDTTLKTNLFDGDFIELEAGENIIDISADTINLTSIKFKYKYTYI